jgi:hypothetical protein
MEKDVANHIVRKPVDSGELFGLIVADAATELRHLVAQRRAKFAEFETVKLQKGYLSVEDFKEKEKIFENVIHDLDTKIATKIEFNCVFIPAIYG